MTIIIVVSSSSRSFKHGFHFRCQLSLLLFSLLGSLGHGAGLASILGYGLDDTDSNSLTHVADGKATKWWVLHVRLDAHWLGWQHLDDGRVTHLDALRVVFHLLVGTTINLLLELRELASNVSRVAIKDWRVSSVDFSWVVKNDDLSIERLGALWWIVLRVTADEATAKILDGDVLDVETNVVSWNSLVHRLVMHFN